MIFFCDFFQLLEIKKNKNNNYNEKKMVQIWKGYCPKSYCEKKKVYCKAEIVLQENDGLEKNLYCNTIVCIAG